ncbi:hypothetical protein GCM10010441_51140 [Kitasatospora paracochleata]|uniref:Uncharacterized protein n=1 Tax=Kitasatospora paracochleata TaxID=58354 RepID=A0ABT1IRP4_9ACTN|nr:hypothetical protein [Kitasatospora paracochleata]MCP2307782.1 hypothetical protein [Kitasatospora paracochleata]
MGPTGLRSVEVSEADRHAHRLTARWAADRFLTVLRRIAPTPVLDRWGQPTGIPDYGSPDFARLAPDDPRREAALIAAAEAWRQECEQSPDRIRAMVVAAVSEGTAERIVWEAERQAREEADWRRLVREVRSWANHPTAAERSAARIRQQETAARTPAASPGWPPVAVPGRPGWRRHVSPGGLQEDRPDPATLSGPNFRAESA